MKNQTLQKAIGFFLLGLTSIWTVLHFDQFLLGSAIAGCCFGLGLFISISAFRTPPFPPAVNPDNSLQQRWNELQTQSSETIDQLNREVQKWQQKQIRAEERCLSYQKLVDVHQNEIEKLRHEISTLGEQVVEKERKIHDLQLAHLEPDLFDS